MRELVQVTPSRDAWRKLAAAIRDASLAPTELHELEAALAAWPDELRAFEPRDAADALELFATPLAAICHSFHLGPITDSRVYAALTSPPVAGLVTELAVYQSSESGPLEILATLPPLPALRRLAIVAWKNEQRLLRSTLDILARLDLPALTELEFHTFELEPGARLATLMLAGFWARLRKLSLYGALLGFADANLFHGDRALALESLWIEGADAATVGRVLLSPSLSALTELFLQRCELRGAALAPIVPLFRQIRRLDLSLSEVGDAGAHALAAVSLPQLVDLNLSGCWIGPEGAHSLAGWPDLAHLQRLRVVTQRDVDDDEKKAALTQTILRSSPYLREGVLEGPPTAPSPGAASREMHDALGHFLNRIITEPEPKRPWWRRILRARR